MRIHRSLAVAAALFLGLVAPIGAQKLEAPFFPRGQYPGTATNDSATAGNIGQIVSAATVSGNTGQVGDTITVTIASPGVVSHGGGVLSYAFTGTGCAVINFTTTGALPTGLVVGTNYYVGSGSVSGNSFSVATSCANAIAGTYINTTGSQSGVHTGVPTAILATGSTIDTTGIQLTAGDWEVYGSIAINSPASTSFTTQAAAINTTSNTLLTAPFQYANLSLAAEVPGAANTVFTAGPVPISVANGATQNVFCMARATFSVSTAASWGKCYGRRRR